MFFNVRVWNEHNGMYQDGGFITAPTAWQARSYAAYRHGVDTSDIIVERDMWQNEILYISSGGWTQDRRSVLEFIIMNDSD